MPRDHFPVGKSTSEPHLLFALSCFKEFVLFLNIKYNSHSKLFIYLYLFAYLSLYFLSRLLSLCIWLAPNPRDLTCGWLHVHCSSFSCMPLPENSVLVSWISFYPGAIFVDDLPLFFFWFKISSLSATLCIKTFIKNKSAW